jgi:hypothetical protein
MIFSSCALSYMVNLPVLVVTLPISTLSELSFSSITCFNVDSAIVSASSSESDCNDEKMIYGFTLLYFS